MARQSNDLSDVRRSVGRVRVLSVDGDSATSRVDKLAGEEPMEIRAGAVGQEPVSVAVTMRTPGSDFELAAGFLVTEGLVAPGAIEKVSYCDTVEVEHGYNIVTVRTSAPLVLGSARNFYATSSCGICGKASLDAVEISCDHVAPGPVVAGDVLRSLPAALRAAQKIFESTGGLHAAGLFDEGGAAQIVREDVGRHNAMDKVVGRALFTVGLPLRSIVMVSGRASFEIVQKAAVAGAPIVCAVSAPSDLAVQAAESFGITLVGFLRDRRFNVYSHPERIAL
jgi:FdhD protein